MHHGISVACSCTVLREAAAHERAHSGTAAGGGPRTSARPAVAARNEPRPAVAAKTEPPPERACSVAAEAKSHPNACPAVAAAGAETRARVSCCCPDGAIASWRYPSKCSAATSSWRMISMPCGHMASHAPQALQSEARPGTAYQEYRLFANERFSVMSSRLSRPRIAGIATLCGQSFTQ